MMRAGDVHRAMRTLPVAPLDAILGGRTALILAPHADDESLGCGGLIAEACAKGRPPWVLVLTDGTGSHPNSRDYPPDRLRAVREAEARAAVDALGLPPDRISFLGLRDTAAPTGGPEFGTAVDRIVQLCAMHHLQVLLAPWRHDPHCDHEAAHLMAAEAAARLGLPHLAYPIWGWTLPPDQSLPGGPPVGHRLDISRHSAKKQRAIQAHQSQYGPLIGDDPAGFQLPRTLLAVFETGFETFLSPE